MPTPFLPDDDDDNNSGSSSSGSSSGSGDGSNSSGDGIDNPLQLNWIAIPEEFEQNCNTLREFIVFRQKLPSNNSEDKKERKLYTFISRQRHLQQQNKLDPAREALLNSINRGILAYHRGFVDDKLIQPSEEWMKVFESFNTETNRNKMAQYIFPSTGQPYITTEMAGSFEEYLLRKIGHQYFSPDECHAGRTPGTVQHLASYILNESSRPKNVPDKSKYDKIIVTRDKELLRHHSYSSSYFPPNSQTDDFKEALDKALKDIMMDDAMLNKIRRCKTVEAVLEIEQRNPFFDTSHFSEMGRNKKFVPIMTSTMQQPRRISFSTYTDRDTGVTKASPQAKAAKRVVRRAATRMMVGRDRDDFDQWFVDIMVIKCKHWTLVLHSCCFIGYYSLASNLNDSKTFDIPSFNKVQKFTLVRKPTQYHQERDPTPRTIRRHKKIGRVYTTWQDKR